MKKKLLQKTVTTFKNHQEAFVALAVKDHYYFIEKLGLEDYPDDSIVTIKLECGKEKNGYYQSIVTAKIYSV